MRHLSSRLTWVGRSNSRVLPLTECGVIVGTHLPDSPTCSIQFSQHATSAKEKWKCLCRGYQWKFPVSHNRRKWIHIYKKCTADCRILPIVVSLSFLRIVRLMVAGTAQFIMMFGDLGKVRHWRIIALVAATKCQLTFRIIGNNSYDLLDCHRDWWNAVTAGHSVPSSGKGELELLNIR